MSASDTLKTIGRIIWYVSGIGILVLVIRRWVLMYRGAPTPIDPGSVDYKPTPTPAGQMEAEKAEALRLKIEGMR